MNRFLKTIGLLLCGGLFTATGWAETIASNREQLWAAWNPMQLDAPTTYSTQNNISAEGWRIHQGGASYMAHTLTPTEGRTAPYVDFGAEVGFGYTQNPITIVTTIKLPAEMTSDTPKILFTLAGYQNTTRFHLGLKSISETGGAEFNIGYNNDNWQTSVTAPDLKPGQKVTLALFYSKSGIVLSQINYRGATQIAKWSGMQAQTNSCTRVTFGADHNTSATISFAVYGIEIYRNEGNETALTFPVNLKQQINQETIGINFSRKDATLSTSSDELYGYQSADGTQGGFLAERAWASFYAPNNSNPFGNPFTTDQAYAIVTAGNPALNVTLTKKSGNNVWGPNANKLFGSYLDNGSILVFNGLPTSGYDVAIIFAGDGQSGNFSCVTVNGTDKTYNANGELIDGSEAWGSRSTCADGLKKLEATGTATENQVMYLADMNTETLTLRTYSNEGDKSGRGTIAAIQIYIHEASYSPVLENANSYWTFENSFADLKGAINWVGENNGWDNNDTDAYVESLRVNEAGEYNKAVKISDAFHPGPRSSYTFSGEFTAAAFVNVANCPDKGVIASFGNSCWLRKLNATETAPVRLCFGDATNNVTATIENLTLGYHLVVVTKSATGISIQIDDGAPVSSAEGATLPTIGAGFQLGTRWEGPNNNAVQATNLLIDEFGIWNRVLKADEIAQLVGLIPAAYPLSMLADKNSDGVISTVELDAVVGKATKWNVSGEVAVQLDEDRGLTALTLVSANTSDDSLTVTGAGSLYNNAFALTTAIPVDITNQKNNPTITLSGTGNVTIRKGQYGIVPVVDNYTGTFTVDDGQQITNNGSALATPFTVGENGAKLHAGDTGGWTVSSIISGSGNLIIDANDNEPLYLTANETHFTGDVVVEDGTVVLGALGPNSAATAACFGAETTEITIKSGATFKTNFAKNSSASQPNDFVPSLVLEPGSTLGNIDGHVNYAGDIVINDAGDATSTAYYWCHWDKTNTFSGALSGEGTLELTASDTSMLKINPADGKTNTFSGTYFVNDNQVTLWATTGAVTQAAVRLANQGLFALGRDLSIAGLSGTAGTVKSDSETVRTLTLNGDSDVRNLTFTNVNLVIASGETFITSITKATVAAGAKVKVVLTADQKLNGLTLSNVTVAEGGSVAFFDLDGTTELQSSSSNVYAAAQTATYTVTAEGGSWSKEPAEGDAVVINFENVAEPVDLANILEGVSSLAKLTISGADDGTITNVASDLLCPVIAIDSATTLSAEIAAIADTIEVNAALSIAGTEDETTIAGVISGDGQVKVAAGKVKFTNTNTYTGGTDIAADATLTMGNANAIGTTGNITGAGTLKFSGFIPANLNGLTTGSAASDETPASGWTGTFYMMNRTSAGPFSLNDWGNANSTICLENCSGYLTPATGATFVSNFRVEGNGWRSQNGDANGGQFIFTGALSGSGKLEVATATPEVGNFYKFTGDISGFTGYVNVTNNHRVVFGDADSQGNGKIVIAGNATIAAGMTWSAVNGIAIMDGAQLTVKGAITGAIANAGTLTYGVDTTVTNAISGEGFIVANGEGVELDLCSATLTDFSGFLNATGGAVIKLPYAETEGKTLSADGTSKFIVVLNNDETDQNDLHAVTVTGLGTLEFVDEAGHTLPSSGSTYVLPTYTVTDDGGSWNVAPLQYSKVVIDFAGTTGETIDLATILGDVTALTKLTVTGSEGGTITKTEGVATVEVVTTAINTNTTIDAGVANLGAVTIADEMTLTVKDTATVSTLSGTGVYNLDLGDTSVDNYTFAADGKNYKISAGTFANATLNISETQTNYEFAGGDLTFTGKAGQFSFGTADVTISGGTINATRLVTVQEGKNRVTTITQTGGDIFLSGTGDGSNTGADVHTIMFGHWPEASSSYLLSGGSLVAANGGVRFGNDSPSTMEISGEGLLKVKGIKGKGTQTSSLTMTGGTLSLGDWGFNAISNFTFAVSGGEINAFGNATISQAVALSGDVTLSADAEKTMKVTSAITGTATLSIAGAGTVDLSGATIANTIALEAAAGATVIVPADQLSTFAKVTIPETATLKVKTNYTIDEQLTGGRKEYTLGEDSSIAGTVTIDGVTGTGTLSDGKLTVSFNPNPTLTGNAWWWDYEFNGNGNNIGSEGTALSWDGDRPYKGSEYTEAVEGDTNQMLKLPARPWRDVGTWPTEATFVMYAKAGTKTDYESVGGWNGAVDGKDNGILVSFGSSIDGGKTITLMTGAKPEDGDMRLVYAEGKNANSVVDLVENLSVPNATTSYHLYAFVLETVENNTKTQISVYVDGGLVATYTADSIIQLGGGFQIASVHGGPAGGLNRLANEDTATMDFLRVYNGVLSAEAMQSLANAYQYTSSNGTASREVANADTVKTWIGEGDQTVWTQTTLATDGSGTTTDVEQVAPTAGSVVKVTVADTTSVALNIPAEGVSYETLDISEKIAGDDELTLTAVENAGLMTIAGKTSIKANTTIAAGAVKIGAVDVAEGKTLTFDYSAYGFSNVWTSTTIPLTGLATGKGLVAVELPETKPAQITNWECVKDPSTSTYALVITVGGELSATIEYNALTWKIGETAIVGTPADFTAWATIPMTVVGENTLTLDSALTLNAVTVSGGTLTLAGAGLTVTTLTLDNASVVATPTTLSASAVTGAVGEGKTNALTMNIESGDYTRAMALSNCSFTKAGAGTLKLAVAGTELNNVDVTLAGGELKLGSVGNVDNGDPRIESTTFKYAGGTLTSEGWVRSASQITFNVPESINNAVAFSGLNLKEPTDAGDAKCSVVKTGAGALTLYLKDAPYAGTTTVSEGTMAYAGGTCTLSGAITVKANAAIKGSANCTLTSLILEKGAIIDATVAPVTATGVELPTGEGAKVVLKKDASGDVLTYTGDVPNMNLFTTATTLGNAMLGVKVNEGVVTLVLTQVSVPEVVIPDDATDEERAELVKQQAEAEVAAQIVADALAASTVEEIRTANVTAIENPGAASVIENADVELTKNAGEGEETYTAKFTYDFGVSALDVVNVGGQLYVVIMANLDNQNGHKFADGVTVTVTDGDKNVTGAVPVTGMDGATTTDAPTGNTRYFRFRLPTDVGTHSYKVKASN